MCKVKPRGKNKNLYFTKVKAKVKSGVHAKYKVKISKPDAKDEAKANVKYIADYNFKNK